MSRRGLVVALLCGVLGVGLGVIVAYAAQPAPSTATTANPISAVSPSVPIDEPPPVDPPAEDIGYPPLDPNLRLPPPVHTIGNQLATWTYHVPQGWQAYAVCGPGECPPSVETDDKLTPQQADRRPEVRYRPPDEPITGGYSLRVKILDNTLGLNPGQMVGTKVEGFRQTYDDFQKLEVTPSAAYFTYRDGNDHLRYNYFQWFAVPGSPTATLEMSVAGRKTDVPGLKALFDRFADNATGELPPPPKPDKKDQKKKNDNNG